MLNFGTENPTLQKGIFRGCIKNSFLIFFTSKSLRIIFKTTYLIMIQSGLSIGGQIVIFGARRYAVPVQPEGPHAETHSLYFLPTPYRGGTPIQQGRERGTRCLLAMGPFSCLRSNICNFFGFLRF